MQQRVMATAQQDQVIKACLATIAPVMDMVGIHEARFATAGEPAALIAQGQRSVAGEASGGRDGQREVAGIAFQGAM
jgi:hypothetical protein